MENSHLSPRWKLAWQLAGLAVDRPGRPPALLMFSIDLQRGKLTKKRSWGAKSQVIQKITSRFPQRFWRSVSIGVWSARDHFVPLTMRAMRFPSRLVRGIGEQKVGRTLLLLLKLPPLGEFLLAWFRKFLERKEGIRVSAPWLEKQFSEFSEFLEARE